MYFNINFNVFFKIIKVHLLVSELYIIRYVFTFGVHVAVRSTKILIVEFTLPATLQSSSVFT